MSDERESRESQMWTEWVRERAVCALPPEKLLPDRQPSYVSSWIYVFGVATIAALIVIVASGVILGLKGPAWWHVSSVGRFFNSVHLWSVEVFFFVMVVHLWGKFFMGAWRGGRAPTWVTGAVIFLVAIGTAFTGYLSQQNFDAQWIASEGKDGLNSVGIGAYFNVADFGQMYTFHVILLPTRRGRPGRRARPAGPPSRGRAAVSGPDRRESGDRRRQRGRIRLSSAGAPAPASDEREWHGDYVRYDLIKEFVVALAVITALTVVLAVLFSSPDDQPITIQNWARADPGDFVATAVTELDGTSELASYGPPYNDTPGAGQKVLGVPTQRWPGVHYRIDTARDFVLDPLAQHSRQREAEGGRLPCIRPLRRACSRGGRTLTRPGSRRRASRTGSRCCLRGATGRSPR